MNQICLACYYFIKSSLCVYAQLLSLVQLLAAPWTVACQAALLVESSRQEYWSGLPFPTPGALPNPGIEPKLLCLPSRQILYELRFFYNTPLLMRKQTRKLK